jgi:hypothetical protein
MRNFLGAVAALGLAVVATPATAVTWGAPDGDDHPNVVALLFVQNGIGFFSCSGTLLTPYVVLTAGHCTEGGGEVNSVTYVRNDADIDAAFALERPGYPSTTAWLNDTWVAGQAVPHPDFNDFAEFPNTFDIGLILLEQPIYVAEYGAMPSNGQFDYLRKARGKISERQARVVGYGLQGRIPALRRAGIPRRSGRRGSPKGRGGGNRRSPDRGKPPGLRAGDPLVRTDGFGSGDFLPTAGHADRSGHTPAQGAADALASVRSS